MAVELKRTPNSRGATNSKRILKRYILEVPTIQDITTGNQLAPILPPNCENRGYVSKIGRDINDWIKYEQNTCADIYAEAKLSESQQRKVEYRALEILFKKRGLRSMIGHHERLAKVKRDITKNVIREMTPAEPLQPIKEKEQPKKRPGFLKSLVTAVALTGIGIGLGAGCNELSQRYKRGEFDTHKEAIVKYLAEVTR